MKISFKHSLGLTLIELMIAMVLGVFLLLGITGMFITNKRIFSEVESVSRLQENARFALEMLIGDIRMAGYAGCSEDIKEVLNHVNGTSDDDDILSFTNAVEGSDSAQNWQPSNSTDQIANFVAGTDGISVRFLEPSGIKISSPMPNVSAELKVTTVGDLELGDIIALSDCNSADIMQLTQVQDSSSHLQHNTGGSLTPGNATKDLQKKYDNDAEIMRFISHRYYIRNNANGMPSLYRQEEDGSVLELFEGVETMQILYGEDTSGNDKVADTYVTATNVTIWDNVVSVRLSLLFQTINENFQGGADTKTYTLLGGTGAGGVTITSPNDYRRRRAFTTVIQLRNRSI